MADNRCCLCNENKEIQKLNNKISATKLSASSKTAKDVLMYIAKIENIDFVVSESESLCLKCYRKLKLYDDAVIKALKMQQELAVLLAQNACFAISSTFEEEALMDIETMEEVIDNAAIDDRSQCSYRKTKQLPEQKKRFFEMAFDCPDCSMRFKSQNRLDKHINNMHKKYKCSKCDYRHQNENYVKLHMNTHEHRDETCCVYCYKKFSTKISTIRHMESHSDVKKYMCDICGMQFTQTTVLYNHKLQHEAEKQQLQCDICKQPFKTKRTFRHHMITHQEDRPRFQCDLCPKTFTEKYTLKVHKRLHAAASDDDTIDANMHQQQFMFSLQNTPEVGSVVQIQSTDENPLDIKPCCLCGQFFSSQQEVQNHMRIEHEEDCLNSLQADFTSYVCE